MKTNRRTLIICLAVPLAVGALSALLSGGGMEAFDMINKPALSPPAWLFPVVWTILYVLMGVASYLVIRADADGETIRRALTVYGVQLAFNFLWSPIFFGLEWYLLAFVWLVALWVLIIINIIAFFRIDKTAGSLLIPYLLWVSFAGYLNFAVYLLN